MRKIYLFFSLLVICISIKAQVIVSAKIDSLQLFIGEQTGIVLDVTVDAGQKVLLPALGKGTQLVPNVEVIKSLPTDTTLLNDGKRMQLCKKYIITAWDSSLYYLPSLEVKVNGEPYQTKSLALKVYTVDVDTTHVNRYFGPKEEMQPDFAWEDWSLVVWCALLVVLLVTLSITLYVFLRTGVPIIHIIKRKPKVPAHEVALEAIEKIKQDRKWEQTDSKEYYTLLTDTLRTYIQDRYGFSAMGMTSNEIIARLTQENNHENLDDLSHLFYTADLVKFAKLLTLVNENDANLMTALQYIEQTKQQPNLEEKDEPIVQTIQEQRSRITRATLGVMVILSGTVAICLLVWITYRLYDLMM